MTAADSLRHVIALKDSLLDLAATRTNVVQVKLAAEATPWWRTELAAALAGAVVGALITFVVTVTWDRVKAWSEKERGRRLLRQAILPTVIHCRSVAEAIARYDYVSASVVAEVAADAEAFDRRHEFLERFRDETIAMRFNGWYATLNQALAMVNDIEWQIKGQTERREALHPDFEKNVAAVGAMFRRLCTWGSHIYTLVGAADRAATRPWIRRSRRSMRRLRHQLWRKIQP